MLTSYFQAKEYLANPDAFVAAAPVAEATPAAAEAKAEEKEEEKEESDDDMVSVDTLCSTHRVSDYPVLGLWFVRLSFLVSLCSTMTSYLPAMRNSREVNSHSSSI
jgi:hypothetical protein